MNTFSSFLPVRYVIDFSTDATVCIDGMGSVHSQEPAVVLKDLLSDTYIVGGAQAVSMQDRLSEHMQIVSCIERGRITNVEATQYLLSRWKLDRSQHLLKRFIPQSVGLVVSYRWSSVQKSMAQQVLQGIGFSSLKMITHGEALVGSHKDSKDSENIECIVYVGFDYTDVYLMLGGKIVRTWTVKFGNLAIQESIFAYVMRQHSCVLSQKEYIAIRKDCVSLGIHANETIVVHGKHILNNDYVSLRITSKELQAAISVPLERLIVRLKHILQDISVGEREDLMHTGIILAGAGCELKGLDRFISERLQVPVEKVLRPQLAAALSAYQIFTKI